MGYRERVTEVHPDVNDDPDADAQFRRLTTARETLLDADERARYDRLGHASYVRHHVSCSAWEVTVPGTNDGPPDRAVDVAPDRADDVESSDPDESGQSQSERASGRGTRRSGRSWGQHRHSRGGEGRNEAGAGTGSERTVGSASAAGPESRTERGSGTGATGEQSHGHGDGQGTSHGGSAGRARADAAAAGSGSYGTSSFWDSQRVGKRYGTSDRGKSLLARLFGGMRALGPWVLVHLVFLASAVGVSWYVYVVLLEAHAVSPLLLVVLVGEIALAATLSTIHVITRIYR
jgi:curved DNA-binding protein CbpA